MSFNPIYFDQLLLAQYMLQVQQAAAQGERNLFQLAGNDFLSPEWRTAAVANQIAQHNMLNQMFFHEEADPEPQYRGAYNRAYDEGKIGSMTRQKHSNANAMANQGKHNYGNNAKKK